MSVTVAGGTRIEWADFTHNIVWGCEKISPGCAHCYADTLANHRAHGQHLWGAGHGYKTLSDAYWRRPLTWARTAPAILGRRPRVFCSSMADVFEERPELDEHRDRLFDLIRKTPELDWMLLTKRPDFAREWLQAFYWRTLTDPTVKVPLRNVWVGVSIENSRFTWRADVLRDIPAAVRFISAEPLLGSLFDGALCTRCGGGGLVAPGTQCDACAGTGARNGNRGYAPLDLTGIDWVIAGGESGHGARPMHPDWARELRDACLARNPHEPMNPWPARPAFFFKQWGHWGSRDDCPPTHKTGLWLYPDGSKSHGVLSTGSSGSAAMFPLGKNVSGRRLDGREWDEFPRSVA